MKNMEFTPHGFLGVGILADFSHTNWNFSKK